MCPKCGGTDLKDYQYIHDCHVYRCKQCGTWLQKVEKIIKLTRTDVLFAIAGVLPRAR